MVRRRRYDISGTRQYLWLAIILLGLSLWFAWDGWFPRASVRQRHPDASDHYYTFNRSVAVLLLSAAAACGYIHMVVR